MKNKKRILTVKIKHIQDSDADTSYLGTYDQKAKTEYAIDRRHSEDCESLRPPLFLVSPNWNGNTFVGEDAWAYWNGNAESILERVRMALENMEKANVGNLPQVLAWDAAIKDATKIVWDLERETGQCDCGGHQVSDRQLPYFNANVEKYVGESPADIRKYVRQDFERMESLNDGQWYYICIRAEATVQLTATFFPTQTIMSGGLYGIESDSGKDNFAEVEQEQLGQLREQLMALGFSKRAISVAFKSVQEVSE